MVPSLHSSVGSAQGSCVRSFRLSGSMWTRIDQSVHWRPNANQTRLSVMGLRLKCEMRNVCLSAYPVVYVIPCACRSVLARVRPSRCPIIRFSVRRPVRCPSGRPSAHSSVPRFVVVRSSGHPPIRVRSAKQVVVRSLIGRLVCSRGRRQLFARSFACCTPYYPHVFFFGLSLLELSVPAPCWALDADC